MRTDTILERVYIEENKFKKDVFKISSFCGMLVKKYIRALVAWNDQNLQK